MMAGSPEDRRQLEYRQLRDHVAAQVTMLRQRFGAPGDYGYEVDAGRILLAAYGALATLDAKLFEITSAPGPGGAA